MGVLLKNVTLKNKNTGELTKEQVGFAWPALLFNCFYLAYRKDWPTFWGCFILNIALGMLPQDFYTPLIFLVGVAICFLYNNLHIDYLINHGWIPADERTDQILLNNNIHTKTNKNMKRSEPTIHQKYQEAVSKSNENAKKLAENADKITDAYSKFGGLHCPRCLSKNIQIIGQHKKGFSAGKAIAGTFLAGGLGSLAGFAGKKTKKVDMICLNCGKKFKS